MKTFKSFAELAQINDDIFDRFIQMDASERNNFFKEKGISWGGEYLGVYIAKKDKVRIRTLTNPFNGKTLECSLVNRRKYSDKTRLVVKLITIKTAGHKQTPENIFGAELVGLVDTDADQEQASVAPSERLKHENASLNRTVDGLKEQNNKLKNDIVRLQKKINYKDRSDLARQNEELNLEAVEYRKRINELREQVNEQVGTIASLNRRLEVAEVVHKRDLDSLNYRYNKSAAGFQNRIQEIRNTANILIKRRINLLLHVTRIENLETILQKGIMPVLQLHGGAVTNDKGRYDGRPDCTSLSVGRVNFYYFRHLIDNNRGGEFVCLYIDPFILLDDNVKYYCHHNAATNSIKGATSEGLLTTSADFEGMFADKVYYTMSSKGNKCETRGSEFEDNWPTSIQAEILYKGVIQPEYIKGIGFKTQDALEASDALLQKYDIKGDICSDLKYL